MKYRFVLFFAALIVGTTAYSFIFPGYVAGKILGMSDPLVWTRFLLVAVLVLYVISSRIRTTMMQVFLGVGGAILLGYGLVAFFSPMFFGLTDGYVPIGDVVIWIEGGITAMLLSLEVPPQNSTESINQKRRVKFIAAPLGSKTPVGQT